MTFTRKDINRNYYTIGEVADIIQVTTRTLQRWDKKGILKFERSPTNRRILPKDNLISYLKSKKMLEDDDALSKSYAIYDSLLAHEQVDSDSQSGTGLFNQIDKELLEKIQVILEQIQTINDLEDVLGKAKVSERFMQHYIKLVSENLPSDVDFKSELSNNLSKS